MTDGPVAARHELVRLVSDFGRSNVFVELWDHGLPMDSVRNDAMAGRHGSRSTSSPPVTSTTTRSRKRLASAMAAVRAVAASTRSTVGCRLPACVQGEEQAFRFGATRVWCSGHELGMDCAFDLSLVAPNLPPYPCPDGLDEMGYLRRLVEGGTRRYGPRSAERVEGAWAQLDRELDLIDELGFPGYFLVVWDIVDFCRRADILCQGRGSAANSAVCFALGITNADAVSLGLLFERFLSPSVMVPPTSTSTWSPTVVRKSSSTSTTATAVTTPPRSPTSSPIGRNRRFATWPRRSGTPRPTRCLLHAG